MNSVNREEEPPQTFENRAIDLAQATIVKACSELPELRQMAIIFDWANDLNLGAAPFVAGNKEGPLQTKDLQDLRGMLEQTSKLVTYLGQLLQQSMGHYGALYAQMEEKLRGTKAKETIQQKGQEPGEKTSDSEPAASGASEKTEDRTD